jgi:hypothetical protein
LTLNGLHGVIAHNYRCENLKSYILYEASLLKRYHFWLVVERCRFDLSAGTQAILSEVFRGFPQSLQKNCGRIPLIRPWPLPSSSFPVHYFLFSNHSTLYSSSY